MAEWQGLPVAGTLEYDRGNTTIFDGKRWVSLPTPYHIEVSQMTGWTRVTDAQGRLIAEFQGEPMDLVDPHVLTGFEAPRGVPLTSIYNNNFTTKDSGARVEYPSGMRRDTDKGKPRFDLLIPEGVPYEDQVLTRYAALMARGAEKYSARNWEQANSREEYERMKASALRHMMQWYCGETDEDHAAAVLFNVAAAETTLYKMRMTDE